MATPGLRVSQSGWAALHFLILNNSCDAAADMCKLLLKAGVDPALPTDNRQTALTLAMKRDPRSQALINLIEKSIRGEGVGAVVNGFAAKLKARAQAGGGGGGGGGGGVAGLSKTLQDPASRSRRPSKEKVLEDVSPIGPATADAYPIGQA